MLATLTLIIPLALAASVSPVMLTEQMVVMAGADGRRAAIGYAAGAVATLAVFVGLLVAFGRAIELPSPPHLDASLDVALGVILLGVAWIVRRTGRRPSRRAPRRPTPPRHHRGAFAFGVFSMATNATTLALVTPAAKEIAASDVDIWGRVSLAVILIVIASLPAWAPLAVVAIAPTVGGRALARFSKLLARYGRTATVWLLAAAGGFLLVRGVAGLLA